MDDGASNFQESLMMGGPRYCAKSISGRNWVVGDFGSEGRDTERPV